MRKISAIILWLVPAVLLFQCGKSEFGPPVIELATNIPLKGKVAAWPKSVRISPDGHVVASPCMSDNTILFFNATNGHPVKRIQLSLKSEGTPVESVFSRDGRRLYVQCMSGGELVVFNMSNMTEMTSVTGMGLLPKIIEFNPDYSRLFISDWNRKGSVAIVNPTNLHVVSRVPVPPMPRGIAFTKDKRYAYVANFDETKDTDGEHGYVSRIDLVSLQVTILTDTHGSPRSCILSPDERSLYVSDMWLDRVFIFDTQSLRVRKEIKVSHYPKTIQMTSDGKYLYVACFANNIRGEGYIDVVDLDRAEVIQTIKTPSYTTGLALSPDGRFLWVTCMQMDILQLYRIKRETLTKQ